MKKFKIENLPVKYQNMIVDITWNDGSFDDDILGQVNLDDYYTVDDSHFFTFESRSDLLHTLKYFTHHLTEREKEDWFGY